MKKNLLIIINVSAYVTWWLKPGQRYQQIFNHPYLSWCQLTLSSLWFWEIVRASASSYLDGFELISLSESGGDQLFPEAGNGIAIVANLLNFVAGSALETNNRFLAREPWCDG